MASEPVPDVLPAGPIGFKPPTRSVPISVRIPQDVYEELERYARSIRAPRSYLIVECIRRALAASRLGAGGRAAAPRTRRKR